MTDASQYAVMWVGDAASCSVESSRLPVPDDVDKQPETRASVEAQLELLKRRAAAELARVGETPTEYRDDAGDFARLHLTASATVKYLGKPTNSSTQMAEAYPADDAYFDVLYRAARLAACAAKLSASQRLSVAPGATSPRGATTLLSELDVGVDPDEMEPCGAGCGVAASTEKAYEYAVEDFCESIAGLLQLCLGGGTRLKERVMPAHALVLVARLARCARTFHPGAHPVGSDELRARLAAAIQVAKTWYEGLEAPLRPPSWVLSHAASTKVPLSGATARWFDDLFEHLLLAQSDSVLQERAAEFMASVLHDASGTGTPGRTTSSHLAHWYDDSPHVRAGALRLMQLAWEESAKGPLLLHTFAALKSVEIVSGNDPEGRQGLLLLDSGLGAGLEEALAKEMQGGLDRFSDIEMLVPVWLKSDSGADEPGWRLVRFEVVDGNPVPVESRDPLGDESPGIGVRLTVVKVHFCPVSVLRIIEPAAPRWSLTDPEHDRDSFYTLATRQLDPRSEDSASMAGPWARSVASCLRGKPLALGYDHGNADDLLDLIAMLRLCALGRSAHKSWFVVYPRQEDLSIADSVRQLIDRTTGDGCEPPASEFTHEHVADLRARIGRS